jgi:hypothetical protein
MTATSLFATPRLVTDLRDCFFYHTMDIPGHGVIAGQWDLRAGIGKYLGGIDFRGKRVLDVGAASGFLTFTMEKQGAEVVSYDLAPEHRWDLVPFAGADLEAQFATRCEQLRRLNNAYWYCHRVFQSRARMVHGTIYTVPEAIGPVDIASLGSILQHVRDPFLALQTVLRLTRETVIITDVLPRRQILQWLLGRFFRPKLIFLPRATTGKPPDTWWSLSPAVLREFLGVLGFEDVRTTYHTQRFYGSRRLCYTVVGRRTKPMATSARQAA